MGSSNDDDEAEALLSEGLTCAAAGDVEAAHRVAAALAERVGPDDARSLWLAGAIAWEQASSPRELEAARRLLERAVERAPDDADVRHALAMMCEALGDVTEMRRQFVQVRALDARSDREAGLADPRRLELIEQVAEEVLTSLPEPFRSRLAHVPVVLEPRPAPALVAEGFDPRAFGLFEGASQLDDEVPAPTRIVLYTHNLLAELPDDEELAEQVEITVLHEIGHFFGLEEDDMERLGLE